MGTLSGRGTTQVERRKRYSRKFQIRADLVIAEKPAPSGDKPAPKFVIEVKRASASISQMNADLFRLAVARRLCPGIRAFLFVISEAKRPKRFVHKEGHR